MLYKRQIDTHTWKKILEFQTKFNRYDQESLKKDEGRGDPNNQRLKIRRQGGKL